MKNKEDKKYYILYIKQWIYSIPEISELGIYYPPVEINDKYVTIVQTDNNKKFKDMIYKGRKYKLDLNIGYGQVREVVYLEEIKDFDINVTEKEYLNYLKNYIENNKEKIQYILNNNKVYEPPKSVGQKRRK